MELDLFIQSRRLEAAHQEFAHLGGEAIAFLADGQRVDALGQIGGQRKIVHAIAVQHLAIGPLEQILGLSAEPQTGVAETVEQFLAQTIGEAEAQFQLLLRRLEVGALQGERAA